ncbi:MAG: TRAP transporter small permease [Desulfobulbia bacterium]
MTADRTSKHKPPIDWAFPIRFVATALFSIIITLTIAQVFFRLFDHPLIWSEELVRLLLVWIGFLGAAVACWDGTHLKVDAIAAKLPFGLRRILVVINGLIALIFAALLAWTSIDLVKIGAMTELGALKIGDHFITGFWLYLPAVIGGCLMVFYTLARWLILRIPEHRVHGGD